MTNEMNSEDKDGREEVIDVPESMALSLTTSCRILLTEIPEGGRRLNYRDENRTYEPEVYVDV